MEIFLTAFIALFVIVDPLGTASVFVSLTNKLDNKTSRTIALQAAIIAVFLLTAFALAGFWLLEQLGISLSAFRIAGGLLLFVTAFRMIMGYHDPDQLESESTSYKDHSSLAVFPLAIPLLAGPGTMTAAVLLMTQSSIWSDKFIVIGAIFAVQLVAYISMLGAKSISKFLGPIGNSVLARVMGVLLAAMAVQFVADGIIELFLK